MANYMEHNMEQKNTWTFMLNEVEQQREKEFREYIRREYGEKHYRKDRFEYIFSPNGVACNIFVHEVLSGARQEISDLDSW